MPSLDVFDGTARGHSPGKLHRRGATGPTVPLL